VAARLRETVTVVSLRGRLPAWLLALPATAALLAFFVAPLAIFTTYSFLRGSFYEVSGELTFSNFTHALDDPLTRRLAGNALLVGAVTGGVCLALGLPLAYFIRYRAGRLEYLLLFLVVLGMFASYLVRIYAWRTILGADGILNQTLDTLGLPSVGALLFSRTAVILALVHIFVPYVVLVAYAALRNVPRDLLDLAADLGATTVDRWRRVLLPLLAPAAAAGFLYTFVLSASDYVTPQFLGGTGGNMVGLQIQQQFTQFGDYPLGAATSLLMLVLFLGFYGALTLLLRSLGLTRVALRY
jgi:spermidine/putrescine transport system permease protein